MPTSIQLRRRVTTGQTPSNILSGELQLNQADGQIWWGDSQALPVARPALAVRFFTTTATYAAGDLVIQNGSIYRAIGVMAPGAFVPGQWSRVAGLSLPADSVGSLTNDGAGGLSYVPAVPLAGGTMTGLLSLSADPTANLHATTKQYADTKVAKSGATMTGALVLSGAPTAPLQAATKAYADAVGGTTNAGRNRLMNGRFTINQRGTISTTASLGWPTDRWQHFDNATGSRTIALTAATDADRAAIGDEECTFYLGVTTSGAAGAADFELLTYKMEQVSSLAGKTVTLSFWAAGNLAGKQFVTELTQGFGSGGSPSAQVTGIGVTKHTLTTSWARYSTTFTVPSIAGKTRGSNNDDVLQLSLWFSAGANYAARTANLGAQSSVISLWGIQLEEGTQPTPLDKRNLGDELVACQRTFAIIAVDCFGYAVAGQLLGLTMALPTPMRAAPTVQQVGITYGNANSLTVSPNSRGVFFYYAVTATGQSQIGGFLYLTAEP